MERDSPDCREVRVFLTPHSRNVPGVALYFYMLSSFRAELAQIPYFARARAGAGSDRSRSALTQLSSGGNLLAGAVARTSVGFVLNPITILKARFEVRRGGG